MSNSRQGSARGLPPVTDGRALRWQPHRESRRKDLITSGIAAVQRYGPDLSVEQIAASAGTSRAVVYRYFSDKTDLYLAVGRTLADLFVAQLTAAVDAEPDLHRQIEVGVDLYLRTIENEPSLYLFTVRHPLLRRSGPDPATGAADVLATFLASRFGDALRVSGGDSGAAEPWGYGVVGLVRTAAEWWLDRRTMSRDALAGYLVTLVGSGLGVLPATDTGARAEGTVTPLHGRGA